jgi:hypothetical protein
MEHDDQDGWKLAVALVNRYSVGAFDEAERRAKVALDAEDVMAHSIWLAVAKALLELTRPAGEEDAVN